MEKVGTEKNQATESELREWIAGGEEHLLLQSDESEEEVGTIETKIKHDEAIHCLKWVQLNMSTLKVLQECAMHAKYASIKQTNVIDLISP